MKTYHLGITFDAIGLEFYARVQYLPELQAVLSGPPEDCYPGEDSECGIIALYCDDQPCDFLLKSDMQYAIEVAAHEAADELWLERDKYED